MLIRERLYIVFFSLASFYYLINWILLRFNGDDSMNEIVKALVIILVIFPFIVDLIFI